jgi:LPPG:FO 2-phospho-L-lactate transferase
MVLDPGKKVVALAGGVGGAKLVYGLSRILPPEQLTVIGNVGDDFELYGLHISPDLDTVMYTLAEIANPMTGWGIHGDTTHMLEMMRRYGEQPWFRLGDHDLATHLLRTTWLRQGISLTDIMARLLAGLGVTHHLLPVTDDPLATMVETVEGPLMFQDYFVRRQWQPTVTRVWFEHADQTHMTPQVEAALREADLIVFCPSNPVLSIAPMLAVPGVRELLLTRHAMAVAISPFVGGKAVKGPAEKLMRELDLDVSARGLIRYYEGLLDVLVIDQSDGVATEIDGVVIQATQTLMQTSEDKVRLAGEILEWVGRKA